MGSSRRHQRSVGYLFRQRKTGIPRTLRQRSIGRLTLVAVSEEPLPSSHIAHQHELRTICTSPDHLHVTEGPLPKPTADAVSRVPRSDRANDCAIVEQCPPETALIDLLDRKQRNQNADAGFNQSPDRFENADDCVVQRERSDGHPATENRPTKKAT